MSDAPRTLRLVTWNIHGGIGTDGRFDLKRIGGIIRALAPEIAAFQEVDMRTKRDAQTDIYAYLRSQVGDHGHQAWALSGADGQYGQMLASRFPLEDRHIHDISLPGREPRKVMEARARSPFGPLRVISTHLGWRTAERMRQVKWLREIIMEDHTAPLLLFGDLNEWHERRLRRLLSDLFEIRRGNKSFPSRLPLFALDRIICRAGPMVLESRAVKEAEKASDHLPVFARIALPSIG
ncbi:MAG: endonuclease/exonuclease/phosphatase family protein [Alphaproteobacteria bacterium]